MLDYKLISEQIKNDSGLVLALNVLDKAITYITALLYCGYIIFCIRLIPLDRGLLLYRSLLVPAVSFLIVSIYRRLLSSPRPYEIYDFIPALNKNTRGKSFPSRHVFSIFIVAFTILQASAICGSFIIILGILLSIIRVIGGVHFIKDVVCGFAMALIISVICYSILGGVFGLLMLPF